MSRDICYEEYPAAYAVEAKFEHHRTLPIGIKHWVLCFNETPNFAWFRSKGEMLSTLYDLPLLTHSAVEDEDDRRRFDRYGPKVREVLTALDCRQYGDRRATKLLNIILEPMGLYIYWWGPVDRLSRSRVTFIQSLRDEYKVFCEEVHEPFCANALDLAHFIQNPYG